MKFKFIVLALAIGFSVSAQAFECKTVMGGCPADTNQITSAHMHAAVVIPVQKQATPAAATAQAPSNKGSGTMVQTLSKSTLK
jgi:hypothetical protein